jgi:hypothetical protein
MPLLFSAALAAEEFYVVQNPKTGNCKISNKRDDGKNVPIGTASYATAETPKKLKTQLLNANKRKQQVRRRAPASE